MPGDMEDKQADMSGWNGVKGNIYCNASLYLKLSPRALMLSVCYSGYDVAQFDLHLSFNVQTCCTGRPNTNVPIERYNDKNYLNYVQTCCT